MSLKNLEHLIGYEKFDQIIEPVLPWVMLSLKREEVCGLGSSLMEGAYPSLAKTCLSGFLLRTLLPIFVGQDIRILEFHVLVEICQRSS